MKNPSLESDKDRWEGERAGGDLVRSALRPVQQSSAADVIVQDLRLRIHRKLIETLDLSKLSNLEMERVRVEIRHILEDMVKSESIPLSRADRDRLVMEVQHEVFGLGPLETLMKDSEIADILVNTHNQVYVERYGKLEKTDVRFRDDAHLMQIIERIVTRVGRRVDESSPMVDARLADGSRVNAIIPPLALDGPILSIRRFGAERLTMNDLIQFNSVPPQIAEVAAACVKSRLNMLVSGGTGAGKTTLLNCLSNYIPENERIVTIEDSAELKLQQEHIVRLETRPPNIEGQGAVTGGLTDFAPPADFFLLDHDQRHTLSTGLVIDLPSRAFASATIRYGSGFLDGDNSPNHLPGHTLFDLSFGKSFGEDWLIAIQSVNVANRRFLLDNSNTFGGTHFVEPRQVYVEVKYKFHY